MLGANETVRERLFPFVLLLLPEILQPKCQGKLELQGWVEPKRKA